MILKNCFEAQPGGKPPKTKSLLDMEEAEMALLLSSKDGTASPAVIKPSKDSFAKSHKAIPASSYGEEYWKRCIANLMPPKVAEKFVKTKDLSDPFDDNIKRYKINHHSEAELSSAQKIFQPAKNFLGGKKGEGEKKNGKMEKKPFYDNFIPLYKISQKFINKNIADINHKKTKECGNNSLYSFPHQNDQYSQNGNINTHDGSNVKIFNDNNKNAFFYQNDQYSQNGIINTHDGSNIKIFNDNNKNVFFYQNDQYSQNGNINTHDGSNIKIFNDNNKIENNKIFSESGKFDYKGAVADDAALNLCNPNEKQSEKLLLALSKIIQIKFDNNKLIHEEIDLCDKLQLYLSWKVGNENAAIIIKKIKDYHKKYVFNKESSIAAKFIIYLLINYEKNFLIKIIKTLKSLIPIMNDRNNDTLKNILNMLIKIDKSDDSTANTIARSRNDVPDGVKKIFTPEFFRERIVPVPQKISSNEENILPAFKNKSQTEETENRALKKSKRIKTVKRHKPDLSREALERKLLGESKESIKPVLCEFRSTGKGKLSSIVEVKTSLTKIGLVDSKDIGPMMKLRQDGTYLIMVVPEAFRKLLMKEPNPYFELSVWNEETIEKNTGAIAICTAQYEKIPALVWKKAAKKNNEAVEGGSLRISQETISSEEFEKEFLTEK